MNYSERLHAKTLLLVDDEPANLHVLKQILQEDAHLLFARNGQQALEIASSQHPDLVLLDVMLPDIDGYEVCMRLKQAAPTANIPVIFISAMSDTLDEAHGFEVGAVDYICKPVNPAIVRARIATHLSLVQAKELQRTHLQLIRTLGRAAEYRDNETGLHVIRMSHYAHQLALSAGLSKKAADELLHAAPMHDVGKIGIPDHILLKPGALDDDEWITMKKHPEFGAQIIGEHDSSLLKAASTIALSHHEKWDGSGYPNGLKGTDIPLVGRIIAIVDVFDALTTARPYKKAWTVEDATDLIRRESGRHFDPELVERFIGILPQVLEIKQRWAETPVH